MSVDIRKKVVFHELVFASHRVEPPYSMVEDHGFMVHTSRPRRDSRRPYTSHASRTAVARSRRAGASADSLRNAPHVHPVGMAPPHHVLAHHRDAAGISQDPLEPPQACPSDAVVASRAALCPGCTAAPLSCMPDMGRPSSRRLCGVSLSCQILWEHARRISSDDRNMEKGYAWGRVQGACVEQLQRRRSVRAAIRTGPP